MSDRKKESKGGMVTDPVDADPLSPPIIEVPLQPPDPKLLRGAPCPACGSPREPGSRFCTACGLPFEVPDENASPSVSQIQAKPIDLHRFQCDNCGSMIQATMGERSIRCPFCDSTYVAEIPERDSGKQRPEFLLPFEITKEKAQEIFFKWLRNNSWFRPGDLVRKAVSEKQRGVYLPFWHFSMAANSLWSATIGQHWYRTETYTYRDSEGRTQVATRTVQETEWWPLDGQHHKFYFGFMVSASKGLPQIEALEIQPYQLGALARFRPYYLAGWMTEEYSISPEQAIALAEKEFRKRQKNAISGFMPGDTYQNLQIETNMTLNDSDLILLPVYVLSYRYKDKVYRFLINGQTGKVFGEKPWSKKRIGVGIGALVVLIAAVAFGISQLLH